jgi:sugar (pentulose or hexulose) kinase
LPVFGKNKSITDRKSNAICLVSHNCIAAALCLNRILIHKAKPDLSPLWNNDMDDLVLGIDVGTSAIRVAALDQTARLVAFASSTLQAARRDGYRVTQDPAVWNRGLDQAMAQLASQIDLKRVRGLIVDGTSGTLVAVDARGVPVAPASLYNDRADAALVAAVERSAPLISAVSGVSSPLARAIGLQSAAGAARILHQADWIAGQFSGRFDLSDECNALKTGYDSIARCWPVWIAAAGVEADRLPRVVPAGTMIGPVCAAASARFGLPARAIVVAGTTDGCAAFLATGAGRPGDAVTSLGSTLVLKLACDMPLWAPEYGIYSHRIGDLWLAGGASNSGGAVLAQFFTADEIRLISQRIDPDVPSGLDYYPLPARGERFPINDPAHEPRMTPRPDDDALFLRALFEGIATIEALGYRRLHELGGAPPTRVLSVGGGAANEAWRCIRSRALGLPVEISESDQAAVGVARLAWRALGG